MTPDEQKLSYPWANELPEPGYAIDVADGVRWIRMPLPFALDHINLWLLRDNFDGQDGWVIVDCGVSREPVKELWEQVFDNVLEGLPVLRVIVTHMHPDHVGLAGWLCERWNVPLYMTMTDYMTARVFSQPPGVNGSGGPTGPAAAKFFASHGLTDPDSLEQIQQRATYYPGLVPFVPGSFIRIMHGDKLSINGQDWRIIVGYGHAPEHASLYCENNGILISGDMLLPRISTNVSVFNHEPEGNPLPQYLNSLHEYNGLPDDTLILPSHGRPFKGLHERISQQHAHHKDRLQDVLDACDQPRSTADIVPILFKRKLDLHQLTFAMGEALAHLHALYYEGKLNRSLDADGTYRFVRSS